MGVSLPRFRCQSRLQPHHLHSGRSLILAAVDAHRSDVLPRMEDPLARCPDTHFDIKLNITGTAAVGSQELWPFAFTLRRDLWHVWTAALPDMPGLIAVATVVGGLSNSFLPPVLLLLP